MKNRWYTNHLPLLQETSKKLPQEARDAFTENVKIIMQKIGPLEPRAPSTRIKPFEPPNPSGPGTPVEPGVPVLGPNVPPTIPSPIPAPPQPVSPSLEDEKILFKSGFENSVVLEQPILEHGQWRQYLKGSDNGYNWPSAFPAGLANFQYLVRREHAPAAQDLAEFVETRLDSVIGPAHAATRALYQDVKKRAYGQPTQNDFILFDWDAEKFEKGRMRYWIKLQPDLLDIMPRNGDWRQLLEWKETRSFEEKITGFDFQSRWGLYIVRGKDATVDGLAWKLEGNVREPEQNKWTIDWVYLNQDIPVPVGEWFLVDVSWKQHPTNGELIVKINDQVVAQHKGRTQKEWNKGKLYAFMVYTGESSTNIGPAYQWVDDFELYQGL